jgi:hypothetical protein
MKREVKFITGEKMFNIDEKMKDSKEDDVEIIESVDNNNNNNESNNDNNIDQRDTDTEMESHV